MPGTKWRAVREERATINHSSCILYISRTHTHTNTWTYINRKASFVILVKLHARWSLCRDNTRALWLYPSRFPPNWSANSNKFSSEEDPWRSINIYPLAVGFISGKYLVVFTAPAATNSSDRESVIYKGREENDDHMPSLSLSYMQRDFLSVPSINELDRANNLLLAASARVRFA